MSRLPIACSIFLWACSASTTAPISLENSAGKADGHTVVPITVAVSRPQEFLIECDEWVSCDAKVTVHTLVDALDAVSRSVGGQLDQNNGGPVIGSVLCVRALLDGATVADDCLQYQAELGAAGTPTVQWMSPHDQPFLPDLDLSMSAGPRAVFSITLDNATDASFGSEGVPLDVDVVAAWH